MKTKFKSFEALIIYGLYLIPILLWSLFSFSHMNTGTHWTLFALGLLIAALGTLGIRILTSPKNFEESLPQPVEIIDSTPTSAPVIVEAPAPLPPPLPDPALLNEIENLKSQITALKLSQSKESENFELEKANLNGLLEDEQKKSHVKDEQILELKSKINELEYEIKALVDFNQESESFDCVALSESDASRILKKWLEAAGSLTAHPGGDPLNPMAAENLGKLIQGEPSALLFLYSFKEGKALFANSHSLTLFGLTPEQFAAQFHTFLPKESLDWHQALNKMTEDKWAALPLNGAKAVMAPVTKGPLHGYSLGIVY